jgi:hypothetical protein
MRGTTSVASLRPAACGRFSPRAVQFLDDIVGMVLTGPGDDLRVGRTLDGTGEQVQDDRVIQRSLGS